MTDTIPDADTARDDAALLGAADRTLTDEEVASFVAEQLGDVALDGRSVCVLVPDATRSCPLPLLLDAVHVALHGRASRVTVLVALGTHQPLDAAGLDRLVGSIDRLSGMTVTNHAWWDPSTFATIGSISPERVAVLSEGRLSTGVDVRINRAVVDHDVVLIVGPVLPHEVVGFSGGNKYLFPGVSGPEMINLSHWLGALLTSAEIIGTQAVTPVRALIDEAAALVTSERLALSLVTEAHGPGLHAIAFGPPEASWAAAADLAAQTHVRYLGRPVRRVLSLVPDRYADLWTGAKGFYKVEPVVADGGEVVIHAPHITEVSVVHPEIVDLGYHCRDYFVGQWDRFAHLPWAHLAHSTHLRGAGAWDPVGGETSRVRVTLATGIPEETARRANLDYLDPASIELATWSADPDTLVVPDAGEVLYRLR